MPELKSNRLSRNERRDAGDSLSQIGRSAGVSHVAVRVRIERFRAYLTYAEVSALIPDAKISREAESCPVFHLIWDLPRGDMFVS